MSTARGRRWVEVGFVILTPEERTAHLPEDTRRVPYYCRLKGFAQGDPQVGDMVEVETQISRRVTGEVLRVNPPFTHDFGSPVEELIQAGLEARAILDGLEAVSSADVEDAGGSR